VQKKQVSQKALIITIIVSMFFWGLSWPSGKVLTKYLSAVDFTVCRYFIVVVTLFLMLLVSGISMKVKKAGIPSVISAGLMLAVYSYFFFMGLKTGSAGAGGVLVTTLNPIMAYAIGILISRRWPSANESIGLILGIVAGSFLLKLWDSSSTLFDSGNLYFLMAAFTWASMSKITSRGGRYGSSLSFSLWQYLVTLVCLLPLLNLHEFATVLQIRDQLFWWNLFFSSAIVTSLATTVYFYATTRLGAEKASSFIFMVPLAAAVSAWLLLGERILPHTIIGGVLGMAAVYMINKKTVSHKAVTPAEA
jgi:drug/metabolite transporter (DMT)-like permease